MTRRFLAALVALMLLAPLIATAQDLDKGSAAYRAGDFEAAPREWRPLAEQGLAEAQSLLGWMYFIGRGVPQDNAEAVKLLRLAAEQGNASAQNRLGFMYNFSLGVPRDYAEALKWYRLAAEQDDAEAQFNLGKMYDDGQGVAQDFATAHMWFNISSANGFEMGAIYRDLAADRMTPADVAEAQRRARVCMASDYRECG